MSINVEDVLQKLSDIRAGYQQKMISGICGGGAAVEGQMVNYRAAVQVNRELGNIIEYIELSMKKDSDEAEAAFVPLSTQDPYKDEA